MSGLIHIVKTDHRWGKEFAEFLKSQGREHRIVDRLEDCGTGFVFYPIEQYPPDVRIAQQSVVMAWPDQHFIQDVTQLVVYEDKVAQAERFARWMPDTRIFTDKESAARFIERVSFPLISKSKEGSSSVNVRFLKSAAEAHREITAVFSAGLALHSHGMKQRGYWFVQEFIPHNVTWRVTIVGRFIHAYRRFCYPDRPIAAPAYVVPTKPAPMCDEVASLVAWSQQVFKDIGTKFCAIDVLQAGDGWKLLETSLAWARGDDDAANSKFYGSQFSLNTQWALLLQEIDAGVFEPDEAPESPAPVPLPAVPLSDEKITIVCWKWNGWRPGEYDHRHVNRLHDMLKKHMTGKWELVCITDDNRGVECKTFPIWPLPTAHLLVTNPKTVTPNCFVRLRMFDPAVGSWFGKLILSIDIDVVIAGDLRPLIRPDGFVGTPGRHSPLCGGMWQLRPGAHPEVWSEFDVVESPKLIAVTSFDGRKVSGSDQAWMSIKLPKAVTWSTADGVYDHVHIGSHPLPANARVVQAWGAVKPWSNEAKNDFPAIYTPDFPPLPPRQKVVVLAPVPKMVPVASRRPVGAPPLEVITWLWTQKESRSRYTAEHVNTLRRMVARNYPHPHRFSVITDHTTGFEPGIRVIPLWDSLSDIESPFGPDGPSCYRRLRAFSEEMKTLIGPRFVSMDLDCVVVNDLTPIFDRPEKFVIWRRPCRGTPFNGSLWMMDAGCHTSVWTEFAQRPARAIQAVRTAGYWGSDQGWMSFKLRDTAASWSIDDGVTSFRLHVMPFKKLPPASRLVFFEGNYSPTDFNLQQQYPWIAENYR